MFSLEEYKQKISEYLTEAVNRDIPEAILLSGGIDSSAIACIAKEINSNLCGITVTSENQQNDDLKYAQMVSNKLLLSRHEIAVLSDSEIPELIREAVLAVGTFNVYWIAASLVLLKGLKYAKEMGLKKVATGEGSDDIFGSFPVMLSWTGSQNELENFIKIRLQDISVMTQELARYLGVEIVTPYYYSELVSCALSMPLELKSRCSIDGVLVAKYILRETFKDKLPAVVSSRPQTMAFVGASTLDLLMEKYAGYADVEEFKRKYGINFSSPFECYLFNILNQAGRYQPANASGSCLYCHSELRTKESVHCRVCGSLQYQGNILKF